MKLNAILILAAVGTLAACGTPYRATDTTLGVPDNTQRTFITQYPNSSDVVWAMYDPNVVVLNDWELTGWQTLDETDYVVRFNMDGEQYYAWYDNDGSWVGTAYVVRDYNALPAGINTSLRTLYPSHTITSAHREYYSDRNLYEVVMKAEDGTKVVLLVDNDGNVIKKKVKS